MAIIIKGFKAIGNGRHGLSVNGDVELQAEDIYTENNGGDGISIVKLQSLIEQLGLPKEINPKELGVLLAQIQNKSEDEANEIIEKSNLLTKLSATANIANVASLIFAVSTNPNVQTLISKLTV